MAHGEFDLIQKYFSRAPNSEIVLGIGDDCALIEVPSGMQQAITVDTLVEGTHFFKDTDPEALGHKALAVSLSDLASMGAKPAWITLALTIPDLDDAWLDAFSRGLFELANSYEIPLVGGDTTRGPLSITLQAAGWLPRGEALLRSGANVGDLIYVTGSLGDAGLGLMVEQHDYRPQPGHGEYLRRRLHRPDPRVKYGQSLLGMASSAIDISDGLVADLGHVLKASNVGASIYVEQLPHSEAVRVYIEETGDVTMPLISGEDYELCFTIPDRRQAEFESRLDDLPCAATWVGIIEADAGVRCISASGENIDIGQGGYDHFG